MTAAMAVPDQMTAGTGQGAGAPVLEIDGLTVTLDQGRGRAPVPVLENLGVSVAAGRTVALVGESGCGKSMTALAIMGLLPEGFRIAGGHIRLAGEDITHAPGRRLRRLRGNAMSMIFQEPMTALNPVYTVGDQIGEALSLHQGLGRSEARARAIEMLRAVQIPAAESRVDNYPHQMSGGMRQRVMIAMALACRPKLLIADEPTTALDVTVQAQVFDLLKRLQAENDTAIVMITHDLAAVADMADEVAVLYAGRCIERGPVATMLERPGHPYTRGLIACVPHLKLGAAAAAEPEMLDDIPGLVPPLGQRAAACCFAPRCRHAALACTTRPQPPLEAVSAGSRHAVSCWRREEIGA
ncbi:ABC transporter ATP-binding protein [Tistrella sp. BH-R2-4]|uniref:ABC transporter ATP-binding protein n=2 Tax=Geminicoccaceae TaxID=2066434 RepID=A0ABU9YP35_9PROT